MKSRRKNKLYDWGDAINTLAVFAFGAGATMVALRSFSSKKFYLTIWISLIVLGIILYVIGSALIIRSDYRTPEKCYNCGCNRVNVIKVRSKRIPTYFCECRKCLARSKYKHLKTSAIIDWNCTKLTR